MTMFVTLNMKSIILLITAMSLLVSACDDGIKSYSNIQIVISAEKCSGTFMDGDVINAEGLMIVMKNSKRGYADNYRHCSIIPYRIEGFTYVAGYEYELLVRETILKIPKGYVDYSPYRYKLVEVLSKTPVGIAEEE